MHCGELRTGFVLLMQLYAEDITCAAWGLDNIVYAVDSTGMIWLVDTIRSTTTVCADIRQEGWCCCVGFVLSCPFASL